MSRRHSRQHAYLMEESEQALTEAAQSAHERHARIARQVLDEPRVRRVWESRHGDLLRPVSEASRRSPQIIALRSVEVRLIHKRALIRHIRRNEITGTDRDRLFRLFFGPRDVANSMVVEHRQYVLAVSSALSADHLINVMCDPVSKHLLSIYETAYTEYFALFCYVIACDNPTLADLARPTMLEYRRRTERIYQRLQRTPPDPRYENFERQAALARSGRYPVLDYVGR